ncbi:hypothetical protein OsJ_11653 [Oryza sativa Japonica Group]|uniref:Uncharacterized protein n=1 Tax=Oryza sativa subsp. japonica TaxID=39947 RepID=B9F9L3_ORYSJ|nr:hypothetical protein OsJ_11653 [Oryza sativa Japonica Group]
MASCFRGGFRPEKQRTKAASGGDDDDNDGGGQLTAILNSLVQKASDKFLRGFMGVLTIAREYSTLCESLQMLRQAAESAGRTEGTGLIGTAPAPAPPLLELELSQTVSTPPKLGVELGGALSQNVLELWSWV